MVLGTAQLRHSKSISWPTTRRRDVSKRILMEFTIVSNEIQYIMIRNSKLAWPRRSASKWINWHRKTTPTVYPERNSWDIKNIGMSHSTNRARMHRCDFDQTSEAQSQSWTASTENQEKHVQNLFLFINTKGGIRLLLLLPVHHGGSGMKIGGAHIFQNCCIKIVYCWWQEKVESNSCQFVWRISCRQYTSHVTFSHAVNTHKLLHITLHGSSVGARFVSSAWSSMCATWSFVLFLFLTLFPSVCFSHLFLFCLNLDLYLFLFHVDFIRAISHWHSAKWGVWPVCQQHASCKHMRILSICERPAGR